MFTKSRFTQSFSTLNIIAGGACLAALLGGTLWAAVLKIGDLAPEFAIKDQYNQEFRLSAHRVKPVLLVYGDRIGSDYMGAWAKAVRDSQLAEKVEIVKIANLHAVPGFFHGYVTHKFQAKNSEGKPSSPVLLDWDGAVAKLLGFTEDLTNVYLIDCTGVLGYTAYGKGTGEETRKLLDAIGNLGKKAEASVKGGAQ